MTRKRLTLYLVLGILIGLLLTACAGVAAGKFDVPVGNDALVFGPAVDVLSVPALDVRPAPAQIERPLEMQRAVEAQIEAQRAAQMEAQIEDEHFCTR